jgi:hypothetical protein
LVAIENSAALTAEGRLVVPRIPGWAGIAALAVLVGAGGLAMQGIGGAGIHFSGELTYRFTCFVYFLAIVAGPLTRLIPWQRLREAGENRRELVWGFCASFAVYLIMLCLPYLFALVGRETSGPGITSFDFFGGCLALLIACASSQRAALFLGEKMRGIVLAGGLFCFWLAYAFSGLAHITGPHRPDAFYGISLLLMIVALLLRFADHFATKILADHNPA